MSKPPNPVIPFEEKYKILSSVMNGKFSSPPVLIEFPKFSVPCHFTVTFHKSVPPREYWMQNIVFSLFIDRWVP
jgi:hypothetical protein